MVPAGTTWLDIATLLIAVTGVVIAFVSLSVSLVRLRRESRAEVRIDAYPSNGNLIVSFTNTGHRPLSIRQAGFNAGNGPGRPFTEWLGTNARVAVGRVHTDPRLPSPALQPGDPPYEVRAPLYIVKSEVYRANGLINVWCLDERGSFYKAAASVDAQAAVWAVRRRVPGPPDEYGHPTEIEVEDDPPISGVLRA